MLIGAHVSPAGGPAKAVERGVERGCRRDPDLQPEPAGVARPRSTRDEEVAAFHEAHRPHSRCDALLIHAVYLLNCASEDREIRDKSLDVADARAARRRRARRRTASCCTPARRRPATSAPAIKRAGAVDRARRWPRATAARCTSRTPPAPAARSGARSRSWPR